MNRIITLLAGLGIICGTPLFSQTNTIHHFTLDWKQSGKFLFEGSEPSPLDPDIPVYTYSLVLHRNQSINVILTPITEESVHTFDSELLSELTDEYFVNTKVEAIGSRFIGTITLVPIRRTGTFTASRILQGKLSITIGPKGGIKPRSGPQFKDQSVLASGDIFQVSVTGTGVYKIDYNFIKDKLGVEPSTLSPDRVAIFGNGSGRIPQWNLSPRIDDLEQSASMAIGMEDGQINPGDYFMWYAEGADSWQLDASDYLYHMDKNIYDKVNHYYIILNGPQRKSISSRANATNQTYSSNTSLAHQRLEDDKVNLLGRFRPPGSGQEWYGDEMAVVKELNYTNRFDLSDLMISDTFYFTSRFAARTSAVSRFYINFNNHEFNRSLGSVNLSYYEASYASDGFLKNSFVPGAMIDQIKVRFPLASGVDSRAWLDFLEINFWKNNIYKTGSPLWVFDPRSRYSGIPEHTVSQVPSGILIWDIADPIEPVLQQHSLTGNTVKFCAGDAALRPFVCFQPSQDSQLPLFEKKIANQNLHSITAADMLIVYHDSFEEAAGVLTEHRREYSDLIVEAIPASQVLHEFGGGSNDPSAIRDFIRMLYTRDPAFRYVLLIGDATYDYLNLSPDIPYQNFIPAFETEESLDPIRSFPSDDFYALLDDEEGDNLIGAIDVAVGRFPVSTPEEAMDIVNKIIHYETSPLVLNDWRNRTVLVADDEDSNVHLEQADRLAVKTLVRHPGHNQQKIYLDAFPQQSTPGGDRYPDVNSAIDLNMEKGALTVTYLGHGGPNGWTQERVLGINQAQSYDNFDNMPLYITATCSFAGYDEPGFKSAGEHLLTNAKGGAIALMTTVRAVYSGSNERLTDEVLEILYTPDSPGVYPTVGEVLRRAKNGNAIDTLDNNARKFTLLGDPALQLAIPTYKVVVTDLVDESQSGSAQDTLSALEQAVVSGEIRDHNDQLLSGFNGFVNLTVFDKVQIRKTLANDEKSSERNFATQTRQLFKGTATVTDGKWTITFVLPKDIDFSYGKGKMSFYAQDGVTDAAGHYTDFIIGGVGDAGLVDNMPPVIELFMNDNQFRSGGITDPNPDIYAELRDDYGINVSGTSVGHDIEAVLDGDERNSIVLNDFYQALADDHTQGTLRYALSNLSAGVHTLQLTAWDLANNSATAEITFVVVSDESALVDHLVSYPNPFSDETRFAFEHNQPDAELSFTIDIYSLSGQHIKTLTQESAIAGGYRESELTWKGDAANGSQLPSGLYIYRVKAVFTANGVSEVVESEPGKVVIIR